MINRILFFDNVNDDRKSLPKVYFSKSKDFYINFYIKYSLLNKQFIAIPFSMVILLFLFFSFFLFDIQSPEKISIQNIYNNGNVYRVCKSHT